MSDKQRSGDGTPGPVEPTETEETASESKEAAGATEAPGIEGINEDLDKARSEAADYLESLQRLKAEFENFRKRMLKEQSEFLKFASQGLVVALLPVLDNFERALEHEIHGDQLEKYRDGLKLVYNQVLDVLSREGLSAVEPTGQLFDPAKHEAVFQEESGEHEEGTIVRVLEKGYVLKDRVIRAPKVVVAK